MCEWPLGFDGFRPHPLDGPIHRQTARVGGLLQLPPPSRRSRRPNTLRAPSSESPRPAVIGLRQLHTSIYRTTVESGSNRSRAGSAGLAARVLASLRATPPEVRCRARHHPSTRLSVGIHLRLATLLGRNHLVEIWYELAGPRSDLLPILAGRNPLEDGTPRFQVGTVLANNNLTRE
jgi:hypothetical protein